MEFKDFQKFIMPNKTERRRSNFERNISKDINVLNMAKYNVVLMLVAFYSTGFYPALALVNLAQILLDNLIIFEIIYDIGWN